MKVLFVTLAVVVTDQVTKLLIRGVSVPLLGIHLSGIPLYSSIDVIGNFLRFTHVENPGMAFGFNIGWHISLSILRIAAVAVIMIYLLKVRPGNKWVRFSLALIMGGAIGNLIDRVFYGVLFDHAALFHGRVIDFISFAFFDVHLFGYDFSRLPVFNVADASVTAGVIMLLAFYWRTAEKPQGEPADTGPISGNASGGNRNGTSFLRAGGCSGGAGHAAQS